MSGTATAIRRVEQCARIVTTYEDGLDMLRIRQGEDEKMVAACVQAIRELRYALNSLDVSLCTAAESAPAGAVK